MPVSNTINTAVGNYGGPVVSSRDGSGSNQDQTQNQTGDPNQNQSTGATNQAIAATGTQTVDNSSIQNGGDWLAGLNGVTAGSLLNTTAQNPYPGVSVNNTFGVGSGIGDPGHHYQTYGLNNQAYTSPYLQGQQQNLANQISHVQGQGISQLNQTGYNQVYGQQQGLAAALQNEMNGGSPSLGMQMNDQANRMNNNQQLALARRGQNLGASNYTASANISGNDLQTQQQDAQLQKQQELAAQQQYQGLVGSMANGQLGIANTNLGAAVNQQQFIDQQTQIYKNMGYNLQQAQFAANQAYATQQQNSLAQQQAAMNGLGITAENNSNAQAMQIGGAGLGAIGAGFSFAGTGNQGRG